MKNICRKISLWMAILSFISSGCSDFIDPKYEPEFPWRTVDMFEMGVIQPYSMGQGGYDDPPGIYANYELLSTDFCSPIVQANPGNEWRQLVGRTHREVDNGSLNWTKNVWTRAFRAIAGCNEGFDFLAKDSPQNLFPDDSPEKIAANIPRATAELYFWRAFSYYWLALFHTPPYVPGGANDDRILPLKETNIGAYDTYIATTQEIWEFIVSDLKKAKELMPKSFYISGRINYWTICGQLARSYFYMGDFANAEKECTEIINHYGPMGLPNDVMAAWVVQFDGNNKEPLNECMWMYNVAMPRRTQLSAYTTIFRARVNREVGGGRGGSNSEGGWVGCKLSNYMAKKIGWMVDPENGDYTETDIARADKRYGNTWLRVEGYKPQAEIRAEIEAAGGDVNNSPIWDKYEQLWETENKPLIYMDKFWRSPNGRHQNNPRMRVPEFYLMRAAIRFKGNDKAGAAADLKVIRDRAGLTGVYELTAATITENDIDREWVIEMGGEGGHWLTYLVAMQKPIMPGDQRPGVAPVNPPYTGWYWKIPIDEVRLNVGYKDIPDPNDK